MTAITVSRATDMSSDAGFRTWGATFGTNLATLGWVQTADTGQINWSTVTKPTLANTVAGYEIWRMNDALQSTAPIFLKIEYGTGAAATNSAIWITVGFSTDGAGNLNSTNVSTRTQVYNTLSSATAYEWKFSGTSARLGVLENWNYAGGYRYFFIERTHNSDGTDSSTGAMVVMGSPNVYNAAQLVARTGTNPAKTYFTNTVGCCGTGTSVNPASNQWGTNLYLAPTRLFGMGESAPMVGLAGYYSSDLTTGNLTTLTNWDGSSATFLPTGLSPSYFGVLGTTPIAMRFD